MKESPFDDDAPDALDSLRALAMETQEQEDPRDTGRNLVISGLAMLGAAVVVGLIGWWLLKGGMSVHAETPRAHGRSNGEDDVGVVLMLAGAGAEFVAAVFVIFALVSFSKIAMRKMSR